MSAKFVIEGSSAGAVKAVQMLNEALNKTSKEGDKAEQSTRKLQEANRRLAEQADPLKKLTRQTEELARAVAAGELNQKQAANTADRFGREYQESLRKIRASVVSNAEAQVDWFKKLDETVIHTNKVDAAMASAGQSGARSFGSAALASLGSYAAGMISLGTAVSMLSRAFADVETRAQAATDSAFGSLAAAGELQQLGPEAFTRGMRTARRLRDSGVVSDLAQGVDIAANLENSGLSGEQINSLTDRVAQTRIVRAENMSTVGGNLAKFQAAFGSEETGDINQILDKALFVSTIPGVQSGLGDTISETLKFASLFKEAGFSDEETFASYAGVEAVSPSRDNASESLKSFGAQILKRGLVKGNLFETVDNVESQIKGGKTAFDVLGEQNAVIGFQRLQRQRDFIRSAEAGISNAGGTLDSVSGLLQQDPEMAALDLKARTQGQEQGRQPATKEALYDALQSELRGVRGDGVWASIRGNLNPADWLGTEDSAFSSALSNDRAGLERLSPQLRNQLEDYMRRTAEAAESTSRAVRSKVTTQQE